MVSSRFRPEAVRRVIRSLFQLCRRLKAKGALMGATAVDAWGHARATQDIDMLLDFTSEERDMVASAVVAMGGEIDADWARENPREDRMLRFRMEGIQVDVLRPFPPMSRDLLNRRKRRRCYGVDAWVLSLEDLIVLKLQVGRPRDIVVALLVGHPELLSSEELLARLEFLRLGPEWQDVCKRIVETV